MPHVNARSTEYLNTLAAVLDSKQHDEIMLRALRNLEWMQEQHAPLERRSESALHPNRAERERIKKGMRDADAREIYVALLRALREVSDGPLELRIGVVERGKQAGTTDELWLGEDMKLQRGGDRLRKARLFFVSTKCMMGNVIVPGPTAVIKTHSRPDDAVLQVLADIREADPQARIIGVAIDAFDRDVGELLRDPRAPFTLLLPGLLHQRGAALGPMAMIVPVSPDTKNVEIVGHPARDLRGLRAGRNVEWAMERTTVVEDGDDEGHLITRPVTAKVTDLLRVRPVAGKPDAFKARIVRIAHDIERNLVDPGQPLLVCVLGVEDPGTAIDVAITTVSATDEHPRIATFLQRREAARVFAGEARSRELLDNDRATASIAFAALQLDHPEAETSHVT